jgi:uncharacterized membrane protein
MLPWLGIMMLGYAFGRFVLLERPARRSATLRAGLAATAAFVIVRGLNVYGDPLQWTPQKNALFSLMSFLNCEKYPPSLSYALMTLGPALCLLGWLDSERLPQWVKNVGAPLAVLGGVPLFFYVSHLALLRYTSAPIAFMRFGPSGFRPPPGHAGSPELDLWVVYVVWIAAVVLLYFPSRWFLRKKERSPESLLRYF